MRETCRSARIVGFSTHTLAQLDAAVREPVDYIAIGPVFGTGFEATGTTRSDRNGRGGGNACACDGLQVVAIGGITLDAPPTSFAPAPTQSRSSAILLSTGDPRARVREYLARLAV